MVVAWNAEAEDATPGTVYDLACLLALASASVKNDAELADRYGERAVELLRRAFAKGYTDVKHMKQDSDLDSLRTRDDYKKLLKELEEKAKDRR